MATHYNLQKPKPRFNRSKLVELRLKRQWTLEQLAEKLGISHQAVADWENGKKHPRPKRVQLLAQIFHVSEKQFYLAADPVTAQV